MILYIEGIIVKQKRIVTKSTHIIRGLLRSEEGKYVIQFQNRTTKKNCFLNKNLHNSYKNNNYKPIRIKFKSKTIITSRNLR